MGRLEKLIGWLVLGLMGGAVSLWLVRSTPAAMREPCGPGQKCIHLPGTLCSQRMQVIVDGDRCLQLWYCQDTDYETCYLTTPCGTNYLPPVRCPEIGVDRDGAPVGP